MKTLQVLRRRPALFFRLSGIRVADFDVPERKIKLSEADKACKIIRYCESSLIFTAMVDKILR